MSEWRSNSHFSSLPLSRQARDYISQNILIVGSQNFAICGNIDGPEGHYAKWDESNRYRWILKDIIYVAFEKIQQKSNYNKKETVSQIKEETSSYQRGGEDRFHRDDGVGDTNYWV